MRKNQGTNHKYLRIAENIENQILNEGLLIGDKLPSVRVMQKEHGVSMSTILQSYYFLESKGLIEARPQSGYYVNFSPKKILSAPSKSTPDTLPGGNMAEKMISEVYSDLSAHDAVVFSMGVPSPDLIPISKLNKAMVEAMRRLPASGTSYETVQGNLNLRRQIVQRSIIWDGKLAPDEIVTTTGCMDALALSLLAVTEKGDTIAVESPCYFGVLQLAENMGLKVVELPTDASEGIDIDVLRNTLDQGKVQTLLLISNFSNPIGSCMPDENKKMVVKLLEKYNIPLIEDDIYGDIYFGPSRPKSCKSYDESGLVLWCSSFSKTLAPGYRVGWVAPGRYFNKFKQLKLYHEVSSASLQQEAIAIFLENGRYEHHLRRLRSTLYSSSLHYIREISEHFPKGVRVSHPKGGFFIWLEFKENVDTYELYKEAMKYGISIAPGRMFTLKDQYKNCIRLSFGLNWSNKNKEALKKLGQLLTNRY